MDSPGALVTRLADQYLPLDLLREVHLKQNFGELLPYALFGTYVQWLEGSMLNAEQADMARAILADLDWAFDSAPEEVRNLISVQLLENLPAVGEPASRIREMLGPNLRKELARYPST